MACSNIPAFAARAILACIFVLITTNSSGWSAEPLRLSLSKSPLSLPVYVADSLGYFAAEGVPLRIHEVIGGHRTLQELLAGTSDLATSSETVVMFNSFQQSNFAIIATFVSSDDDVKIITRSDTGICTPRQLAGKRIGTVVGSAGHYYLDMVLLMNGIDPKTVPVRNLQPEAMTDALKKGEVDAIAIWEPYPFKALKAVPGARMLAGSDAYRLTFNLIVHKKHLGTRDGDLVKLLRALDRAEQFISRQPLQAMAIMRERLQLDQSFIDWIWPRYSYRLTLDQSLLMTLEGEARWARQEGYIQRGKTPNYLNFIHAMPLGKVRPSAISIVK
ncbi:MAG: ABC transporter substrate-binding protein [Geobacter sp.]|nr:ABC transporter substrate-binding protein [Geobacter sp.]